ncbi:hypothetical protein H8M03_10990 [Sphingomonas sabuli]|uniref:Ig-like domain-containing protein n=1 Tax=Sphingomonas sabuli TaxID=2764186 RepID=A0A7G9L1L8_9SPHN|nr:hypothetical protein [Sphingomonas sabuli]QNM82517.1 hypothetical protein H8M03_10990 [Sphingomonas sabuli]
MTRTSLLLAIVATAALAGCNNADHTIVAGGPDEDPVNEVDVANVQLPPSITATKSYRCKDNSVLRIDWLSDGSARVHTGESDAGTQVQVGEGGPLSGSADAATVTYEGKSCKA